MKTRWTDGKTDEWADGQARGQTHGQKDMDICYDWVVEPPVHVHEVRLQVATLSGCSR